MSSLPSTFQLVVLAEMAASVTVAVTVKATHIFNNINDTFITRSNVTYNGTLDNEWNVSEYIQAKLGPKRLP